MVECSPTLQKLQHSNLKCVDENNMGGTVDKKTFSSMAGAPVTWHAALEQVPSGGMECLLIYYICLENCLCK